MKERKTADATNFKVIYFGLFIFCLALSLGSFIVLKDVIGPTLVQSRAESLDMIVQSHSKSIPHYLTRELRDQLATNGVTNSDKDFSVLLPAKDGDQLRSTLLSCDQVLPSVCVKEGEVVVLVRGDLSSPFDASAVVLLQSSFLNVSGQLMLSALIIFSIWSVLFLVLATGVRRREKLLKAELTHLHQTLQAIEQTVETAPVTSEEGLESALSRLESVRHQVEQRKTVSSKMRAWLNDVNFSEDQNTILKEYNHDIQSPLDASKQFFRCLPVYMETLSRDQILANANSIISCIESGERSLSKALNNIPKNEQSKNSLGYVLGALKKEIESSEKFRSSNVEFSMNPKIRNVTLGMSLDELRPIVWNLVRNAIDANSTKVDIEVEAVSDSQIRFLVTDNGDGIPDWIGEDVFLQYVSTKEKGHGLGLGSVKRRILKCGGSISLLRSGRGAIFEIKLPVLLGGSRV